MRVLVTRPRVDAERTARALAERGHEPVVAPLMSVVATGDPKPEGAFAAVILTSAHGAFALASLKDRRIPVFAVGERTAAAARQTGFSDVRVGPGDGASLAAAIARSLRPDGVLLHIAGRHRKPEPETSLRARGYTVRVWEAYEAVAATALPADLATALGAGRIDVVLHYSRRSAALLADLVGAAGFGSCLRAATHLCLSADAAAPLVALGAPVALAAEPEERALFAALDELAETSPPPAA